MFYSLLLTYMATSHSILRQPSPWRNRESKSAPCGGGQPPTNNAALTPVDAGATITSLWEVTAGDGNGPITIRYMTAGDYTTTNNRNIFNNKPTLAVTMNPIPQRGRGRYPFTFKAPPVNVCKGGANKDECYLQVKSTSNWYSCMTLRVKGTTAPPTVPPTTKAPTKKVTVPTRSPTIPPTKAPPSKCEKFTAGTGTICQGLIGSNVLVNTGTTQQAAVNQAQSDFQFNRFNPLVFRNGADLNCGQALSQYFCGSNLPKCDMTTKAVAKLCKNRCQNALNLCDVDPFHQKTFNCKDQTGTTADSYGACPGLYARKVHLVNRYVGVSTVAGGKTVPPSWMPNVKYPDMIIYAGDKLTFRWLSTGSSNLWRFKTYNDYNTCNFATATELTGTAGTGADAGYKVFTWDTPSMVEMEMPYYFGSKGGGCKTTVGAASQRLKVTLISVPTGATRVPIKAVSTVPSDPPTAGLGGFLGDLPNPDSSASTVQFSLLCWASFLMIFQNAFF